MTRSYATALEPVVESLLERFPVPGIVVAVAPGAGPVEYVVRGTDAHHQPLALDSLFPVASISKLATALTVLRLADASAVSLDDPLARYLPNAAAAQAGVTLRSLLSHSSGLPMDYNQEVTPYNEHLDWPAIARAAQETPLIAPPNTCLNYSNVDYALLALVVEQVTRQPFTVALTDLVLEPLQMEAYLGREPARPVAAVLDAADPHAGTPIEYWNSRFFRSLAMPYGGMVTTVTGALRLVQAFQGSPVGFLAPQMVSATTQNQVSGLPGTMGGWEFDACPWGLGPELRGTKAPHWIADTVSPDSFGHTGSSGCVAWADPRAAVSWAICCSRAMDDSDWDVTAFWEVSAAIRA